MDGDQLAYSIELVSGEKIPSYMFFDPSSGKLVIQSSKTDGGSYYMRITANDPYEGSYYHTFIMVVNAKPVCTEDVYLHYAYVG